MHYEDAQILSEQDVYYSGRTFQDSAEGAVDETMYVTYSYADERTEKYPWKFDISWGPVQGTHTLQEAQAILRQWGIPEKDIPGLPGPSKEASTPKESASSEVISLLPVQQKMLDELNSWDKEAVDVSERPEEYPMRMPSGKINARIATQKWQLMTLGVEVAWNREKRIYHPVRIVPSSDILSPEAAQEAIAKYAALASKDANPRSYEMEPVVPYGLRSRPPPLIH